MNTNVFQSVLMVSGLTVETYNVILVSVPVKLAVDQMRIIVFLVIHQKLYMKAIVFQIVLKLIIKKFLAIVADFVMILVTLVMVIQMEAVSLVTMVIISLILLVN